MKILLLFIFLLFHNCTIAQKEIVQDAFSTFFPYLGNSLCRLKAYEVAINKYGNLPEEKINAWKNYEKQCSKDGSYQLILSDFYASYKSLDTARQILEDSITNAKYDTRYHKLRLQRVYLNLNEMKKAKFLADQMINDYTDWYGGFDSLGTYYYCIEKYDLAKQYLEKAFAFNDKDPTTYLKLGYIAYILNEKDEKVIEYYDKALMLDYIITLLDRRGCAAHAVVLINQGNFEDAKSLLDAEQKVDPDVCKEERFLRVTTYYEEELKKQTNTGTS